MDRFYKANEEITLRFYQMPKILFNNPKYKGLSLGAKATYSILRDRQDLSIKNNWIDEEGNIFLNFSIESLCEILEVSNKTAIALKKELVKYDLLIDKRVGQGHANRLYVLKPETLENTKTCNFYTSKHEEITHQDMKKLHTNDTDFSNTDFNNTNPSVSQNKKKDGQTEFKNLKESLEFEKLKKEEPENKEILEEIELSILDMYFSEYTNILGNKKSKIVIRESLKKITPLHIKEIVRKYKEISAKQEIKNHKSYIQSMIYNQPFEKKLSAVNKVEKAHKSDASDPRYDYDELEKKIEAKMWG